MYALQEVSGKDKIYLPYLLCETCQKFVNLSAIFNSTPGRYPTKTVESFNHHSSLLNLLNSAEAGCHLCTLAQVELGRQCHAFSYQRRQESLKKLDVSKQVTVSVVITDVKSSPHYSPSPFGYATLSFSLGQTKDLASPEQLWEQDTCLKLFRGLPNSNMACYGLSSNCQDLLTVIDAARLSLSTGSDACIAFVRGCMQSCLEIHKTCSVGLEGSSLRPSRLINVGLPANPDTCRICLFEKLPITTSYLTLSHCWGSYNIPKLKNSNLTSLQQQLDWNTLPLTFKQAINVTYQLGFQYIWIDSLCIIQDDLTDWKREGSKMGDIYRNSTLTISALSASNGREGLFSSRNPLQHIPCRLGDVDTSGQATFCSPTGWPFVPMGIPFFSQNPDRAPLLTRGWVIQERALSPRTIYFGHDQLHWECLECNLSDQIPYPQVDTSYPRLKKAFHELLYPEVFQTQNEFDFVQSWISLVEDYTKCNLTYQKDRLIAFDGVLRMITDRRKTGQIAGLMKECFLHDLIWFADSPMQRIDNGAPSWTWASIIGPVLHPQRKPGAGQESRIESILWNAEIINVPDHLAVEGVSEKNVKYLQPCIIEIRGPVVQQFAFFPTLTSAYDSELSSTSSAGGYYYYNLKLDTPTNQQDEPSYLEMGFDTREYPGTVPFRWYYLVVVPTYQSHDEWKRLGLLTVSSAAQERPPVVREEQRIIKLI